MEPKCSSIDHKNTNAIIFCQICKVYLCNKCQIFHSKIFQNHITQNISKENQEIFTGLCSEKDHINTLEYYCKTHNKLCCVACISKIKDDKNGNHKDCDIYKLIDIKSEKEKEFKEDYAKLQELSKSLEPTVNKFKTLKEEINKNKEDLIMEIQKVFTNLRNILNSREDQILNQVEEVYKKVYFDDNIIKDCEKLNEKVKKCLESINKLNDIKNELNYVINYYIEFGNNLNKINELNQKMIKCNSNNIRITFEVNNKELENIIKKYGNINQNELSDDEKVNQIYNQLEAEYEISEFITNEIAKNKIRELKCDYEQLYDWIESKVMI